MKKLFIVGAFIASFLSVKAQQITFGAKAGLNASNFIGPDVDNNKSNIGFFLGGIATIELKNNFYIQPGLIYSQQGAKQTDLGSSTNLNTNYLNIPVVLGRHFKSGFYTETGPQLGFLLSTNVKSSGQKIDVKEQFNKIDLSWKFGAGYMATTNIGIDLHYNVGLNSIGSGGDAKVYNGVFQLGVAYHFK